MLSVVGWMGTGPPHAVVQRSYSDARLKECSISCRRRPHEGQSISQVTVFTFDSFIPVFVFDSGPLDTQQTTVESVLQRSHLC